MTSILQSALNASFSSDSLFIMTAKVSRRLLKLGIEDGSESFQDLQTAVKGVQQELSSRWNALQSNLSGTQKELLPSSSSFVNDTRQSIPKLRIYLKNIWDRSNSVTNSHMFNPNCEPRILRCGSSLPFTNVLCKDERQEFLWLVDLELWVERYLENWICENQEDEHACASLVNVIRDYTKRASRAYADKPEDISRMILAVMQLWVALDRSALLHEPLLRDYEPGFPPSLFEPLLLRSKTQMERLIRVEQYLVKRTKEALPQCPSIFTSVNTPYSLAVRYFDQPSSRHKNLRAQIEKEASHEKTRKLSELEDKKRKFYELKEQAQGLECQYVSRRRQNGSWFSVHSSNCRKCSLESEVKNMRIAVYEWPLPENYNMAKTVSYELDAPVIISHWRDTTYNILVGIMSHRGQKSRGSSEKRNHQNLHDYTGLSFYMKSELGRIRLASTTKSFVSTHYRDQHISVATEQNTCVNNGLTFSLYDWIEGDWTNQFLQKFDIREKCTLKLRSEAYSRLQYAVNNTTHTSNEVIARQHELSRSLARDEFYNFGTLRSGHRLQWRIIARELTARALDFSCYETQTLLMQAAWQIGPLSGDNLYPESHIDLHERSFCEHLLSALVESMGTVEGSWPECP